MLLLLLACGYPHCQELCEAQADCIEADLSTYDASWSEWTGRADRDAWVSACYDAFAVSEDDEVDDVCREESAGCAI